MRKVNLIFQEVLKFSLVFMFAFVWCRYLIRKNLWLALLISLLLTTSVYLLLFFLSRKNQNKSSLKLKEKEDAENMFLSLACKDNPMDFFFDLASKKHKNIIKHKNYISVNHQEKNFKTILWFENSFSGLTISKFMEIYSKIKKEKANKIVVCCKEIADKNLSSFCHNFDECFLILDEYETYQKLYKFYDYYPKITKKYKTEKKMIFKDFVAFSFNKQRTKGYLFSAFILILSSIFIRATIYYCLVASLLIVFALISQFNPYFNTKKENEIL